MCRQVSTLDTHTPLLLHYQPPTTPYEIKITLIEHPYHYPLPPPLLTRTYASIITTSFTNRLYEMVVVRTDVLLCYVLVIVLMKNVLCIYLRCVTVCV